MTKVRIEVRVTKETKRMLDEICKDEGFSANEFVKFLIRREALKRGLAQRKASGEKIEYEEYEESQI